MANCCRLYLWELASIPEYSTTLPDGKTYFKVWKRNAVIGDRMRLADEYRAARDRRNRLALAPTDYDVSTPEMIRLEAEFDALPAERWIIGTYVPEWRLDLSPNSVGIRWYDMQLLEGPAPRGYNPPDWTNFARWKRDEIDRGRARAARVLAEQTPAFASVRVTARELRAQRAGEHG